ncbi:MULTISPECIES: EamA family transporter [unclassified Flavobacterium]|uniref:EamA family transporter n=1 Tax=unclassified Flavobacterium TaxID=196869 RepID=UPI000958EE07|nr:MULTISPECIES: EamA family transporter [unclassified Flavobacterium]MBN9282996.1 EamA family transporter [Flavobacterium sp.]OJV67631.1 MAG: permease [Flavobacterium sp. 40-81]
MKTTKYYLAAFVAFLIWGFFSLGLKPIHHYPSLDILFYRVFLGVILMTVVNVVFRGNVVKQNWSDFKNMLPNHKRQILFLTFGGSILLMANWFFFIFVMNHVSVKAASFAYMVCPILTTVFAYFILKEKLSKWQWAAVGISVFSCVLLSYNHFMDIFFSLIVATTYALYLVSQRKNSEIDKFLLLNIQLLVAGSIMLPFYPKYSGALPTEGLFYICLLIIVVLFTIIPLFLNLYALKGVSSATVGIMIYINPIINFLLAIFYFKEQVSLLQLTAYFLILVSIVVFNEKLLFKRNKKHLEI